MSGWDEKAREYPVPTDTGSASWRADAPDSGIQDVEGRYVEVPLDSERGGQPPPLPPAGIGGGPSGSLVRCEVTGKMTPIEDTVFFQGRRVSAEGKNILLRRLMGGTVNQSILVKPSVIRRFLCSMLDNAILVAVFIPLALIILLVLAPFPGRSENSAGFLIQILAALFGFAYYATFHGIWGQSIGKMVGNYRVVNMDGTPINYTVAAARAFWSTGIQIIPALCMTVSPLLGAGISIFTSLYGLADCIALLVDSQYNRALHDRLAGTRVVMNG